MRRPMSEREYLTFETLVREFCEMRAEYRRRKDAGTLGAEFDASMRQKLNALDLRIERMKSGNELERQRAAAPRVVRAVPAARVLEKVAL